MHNVTCILTLYLYIQHTSTVYDIMVNLLVKKYATRRDKPKPYHIATVSLAEIDSDFRLVLSNAVICIVQLVIKVKIK